jgi:hypothetical protein
VPEEHRVVEAAKRGDMIRFSLTAYTGCSSDGETKLADISVAENVGKTIVSFCDNRVDLLFY